MYVYIPKNVQPEEYEPGVSLFLNILQYANDVKIQNDPSLKLFLSIVNNACGVCWLRRRPARLNILSEMECTLNY